MKNRFTLIFLTINFLFFIPLLGQTTGKVSGRIIDEQTGEPLYGVNVVITGEQQLGAASNQDGIYYIINVPPGTYEMRASMIGYNPIVIKNVNVSVNRTAEVDLEMSQATLQGEEIIIQAEKISVKNDQTSSFRNVSSSSIEKLPVENLDQIVNMQAGVVNGHFRGGRNTEVSYMIDGLQVDEAFYSDEENINKAINVETESIKDVEIITGTFNAEYGRAMSGVVNAVTKDGSEDFHGSASISLSNYFSSHDNIFPGLLSSLSLNTTKDYKMSLEGPIIGNKLTYFINGRFRNRKGHLNGIRRYNPADYNDYSVSNSDLWHVEQTGDSAYVSMDNSEDISLLSKLVFRPSSEIKVSGLFTLNDEQSSSYSHYWKYNPDGLGKDYHSSYLGAMTLNHMVSHSMFYELKASYLKNEYQSYKYEDPTDSRYLHPRYRGLGYTGFVTGGTIDPDQEHDTFEDLTLKFDLNWQISVHHALKTGFQYIDHKIDKHPVSVMNKYEGTPEEYESVIEPETGKIDWPYYELEIEPVTDKTMDVYTAHPEEFACYIQDKIEYESMVINLGLRYDYFDSKQKYPTDRRNPDNELLLPDSMMSEYKLAPPQTQLSPRFGLAYQLGEQALLRFSYGHFFQMPPMYALYTNNIFRVPLGDYETTMGNSQLHAQKTVQYEIGLWQELLEGLGLEVALYYRDIYDLLSTKIISTYNQIEYGLYTNKDYGNARGLEVKLDFLRGGFSSTLNYTLSYTKGNADDPQQTFDRAGSSMDPIKRFIPLSWDQRHTLNITLGYAYNDLGSTLTFYYNSGQPYTFSPLEESRLYNVNLYMNNDYTPSGYKFDFTGFYRLKLFGSYQAKLSLTIYNLLDRLNPVWVYDDTGQPYTTIIRDGDRASHHSDFNEYKDRVQNPTAYSTPREIKIGLGIEF
ncbi:MAG: TonB-dependent receptor [Candidatus Marinimicrobia bacterium]|nr:TonB-dependent receptor [Candidatus Neomarinimicrobiota bacterium]